MDEKEARKRFTLWADAKTLALVERYMEKDNCTTQSEFIEKAIVFYVGYLSTGENKQYLPKVVTSTLKGIVSESDNKQNRILFKLAVELAMIMNLMAANQDIDEVALARLRGECVKEVKRLNGSFTFEDALAWQRG